jgi:hypothetical protein
MGNLPNLLEGSFHAFYFKKEGFSCPSPVVIWVQSDSFKQRCFWHSSLLDVLQVFNLTRENYLQPFFFPLSHLSYFNKNLNHLFALSIGPTVVPRDQLLI